MHYKNGREAKQGDTVVNIREARIGIIYKLSAESTSCNARLCETSSSDPYITVGDCLHIDDIDAAVGAAK